MALTAQKIADAEEDLADLGEIVNGPAGVSVETRYGGLVPTMKTALAPFETAGDAAADATASAAAAAASEAAALASKNLAQTAANDADADRVAAQAANVSAQAAKTAAELAETNAETAETNAGGQATIATAQAVAAASSASAAATSAAEAALHATAIPAGGLEGQVLQKASDDDYDYSWVNLAGGSLLTPGDRGDVVIGGDSLSMTVESATPGDGTFNVTGNLDAAGKVVTSGATAEITIMPRDLTSNYTALYSSGANHFAFWTTWGGERFTLSGTGVTFAGDLTATGNAVIAGNLVVADDPYASGWNGSLQVPTKNALYDKINALELSIVGAMVYQGTWNATTNTPAIPAAAAGNKGQFYKVATAGATNIDGITDWKLGDWIVSNGATWDKIDNTDQVSSVNGQAGVVVLNTSHIAESGSLYFTTARVLATAATGLADTVGTPAAADTILTILGKIKKALYTDWIANVLATVLTGLSTATSTAVVAADTILVAIGKLQAQVNLKAPSTPQIQAVASNATVTPTFLNDQVIVTAQAAALALANWTGTAVDGWGMVIRVKDNGTARAITYGTKYRAADGVSLPATTTVGKTLYMAFEYNSVDDKFTLIATWTVT